MQQDTTGLRQEWAIRQLQSAVAPSTMIYIVRVNGGIQISMKHAGERLGKNITAGMAKAFGYSLSNWGLACSEMQIIEDLALFVPNICQQSGELNIRLM